MNLRPRLLLGSCLLLLLGAGCKNFEVPLTTPEPIKIDPIDVNIRLDVYQHGEEDEEAATERNEELDDAKKRVTNRISEIQKLKDDRVIGENHRGLLAVKTLPGDPEYAKYSKEVVANENQDRLLLMRDQAKQRGVMLHDIQKERWEHETRRAIPGEYIEVTGDKEGQFKWAQKEGAEPSS